MARDYIILHQPLLYSHVDFTTLSSAGVAEILARAKSVPLYFDHQYSCLFLDEVGNTRQSEEDKNLKSVVAFVFGLGWGTSTYQKKV